MPARKAVTLVSAIAIAALFATSRPAQAQATTAPQTATPTPLPPGTADTPGGAARNGVITPPIPGADPAIIRGAPAATLTPVIPPPGSPGGNPTIVPK